MNRLRQQDTCQLCGTKDGGEGRSRAGYKFLNLRSEDDIFDDEGEKTETIFDDEDGKDETHSIFDF